MGITEFNLHGGEASSTGNPNKKNAMYQMSKPVFYQSMKELKQNRIQLREVSKEA